MKDRSLTVGFGNAEGLIIMRDGFLVGETIGEATNRHGRGEAYDHPYKHSHEVHG